MSTQELALNRDGSLEDVTPETPCSNPQMVDSTSDERVVNNGSNAMRHAYRVLSEQEKADVGKIKDLGQALLLKIQSLPKSREMSLAATKTEEAVMWAVKGITS